MFVCKKIRDSSLSHSRHILSQTPARNMLVRGLSLVPSGAHRCHRHRQRGRSSSSSRGNTVFRSAFVREKIDAKTHRRRWFGCASSSEEATFAGGAEKEGAAATSSDGKKREEDEKEEKSEQPKKIEALRGATPEDAKNPRDGRSDGRPTYCPPSYSAMCVDAFACVKDALDDGEKLLEVEFPAVPGEDADYKAASDQYMDANVQYALKIGNLMYKVMNKKVQVLLPDGIEFRRAREMFTNAMSLTEEVTLNSLDGKKRDGSLQGMFERITKAQGLRTERTDEVDEDDDFDEADAFVLVNVSCGELPDVERFVKKKAKGRPVLLLNNQLDTLRADLGLFSFPPKTMHYEFLSYFKPAFYLRSRAYSRSIAVSPFVVNYSGAVFREYPAPWQVMIKQSDGVLACIAEDEDRFTLGEAKEEMLIALGLNDPEGSFMKTARTGLITNTWWEVEDDAELSDAWRT